MCVLVYRCTCCVCMCTCGICTYLYLHLYPFVCVPICICACMPIFYLCVRVCRSDSRQDSAATFKRVLTRAKACLSLTLILMKLNVCVCVCVWVNSRVSHHSECVNLKQFKPMIEKPPSHTVKKAQNVFLLLPKVVRERDKVSVCWEIPYLAYLHIFINIVTACVYSRILQLFKDTFLSKGYL